MGDALHSIFRLSLFLNYDLGDPIHTYRFRYRSATILSIIDFEIIYFRGSG